MFQPGIEDDSLFATRLSLIDCYIATYNQSLTRGKRNFITTIIGIK